MGFSDWLCFDDGLGDASLTNNVTFFLEFGDVISLGWKHVENCSTKKGLCESEIFQKGNQIRKSLILAFS